MNNSKFQIAAIGASTTVGVTDSFFVTIHAVAKTNGPSAPYCLANEFICAQLARAILLPVPPSGIVTTKAIVGTKFFASWNFNSDNNSLPPVIPQQCWNLLPDLSTGLVLFDALVANSDRHPNNLTVDVNANPPVMSVFDHSHALLGSGAGMAIPKFALLRDRLGITGGQYTQGNRHFLLDALESDAYFDKWLSRILSIPDFVIDDACEQGKELGISAAEKAAVRDFLLHRRDKLGEIIHVHENEFRAITQWSFNYGTP